MKKLDETQSSERPEMPVPSFPWPAGKPGMKILMLGWEFPPFISGGLGTACYGLTQGMSQIGAEVLFVLPRPVGGQHSSHVKIVSPSDLQRIAQRASGQSVRDSTGGVEELPNVTIRVVDAALQPYGTQTEHARQLADLAVIQSALGSAERLGESATVDVPTSGVHYAGDLFKEVHRYAGLVTELAREHSFDVIHAHDWMTYPAGLALARDTGKPLVVHIHSTEFDRSGENVNQHVYDIERQGMQAADRVIAVSHLTKRICAARYAIPAEKIAVVYNAIVNGENRLDEQRTIIAKGEKIVLFLGRITMQKGPEYFLAAAKRVLSVMDNVKFVMAGSGDLTRRTIEMAAGMGIGHKVLFPGFLRGQDVERVYRMADLYVMPSVSEPFGIAPLEAMSNDVPVIISKQSGVSEILNHVLSVDFWDIDDMANKIVAVLKHPPLHSTLCQHGNFEVRKLSWMDSAQQCIGVYQSVLTGSAKRPGAALSSEADYFDDDHNG